MKIVHLFFLVWLIFAAGMLLITFIKGKKSLKKFPELDQVDFEFSEKFVSGYSTQSFITKLGGARNALSIKVTKDALWITTNLFFAWFAEKFDLLHLIPIKSLSSVKLINKMIHLEFEKNGEKKEIVLLSRKQKELIDLLQRKMEEERIV